MALYAIGDLHLSIMSEGYRGMFFKKMRFELYKPMDVFDPVWKNHVEKLYKNIRQMVKPEDTLVLTGDHSWGMDLQDCKWDLQFIEDLPGKKILTRGNHDLFWECSRTEHLNQLYEGRLSFLQGNFYTYGDYALVGTKGICYENKDSYQHFQLLRDREMQRLRNSFQKAYEAGYRKYIMFLHYPPTSQGEEESCFTKIAKEYGVKQVIYSHLHGQKRYHESLLGEVDGIYYHLVSSDYLHFKPILVLP